MINGQDDDVHHLPSPPPSRLTRAQRRVRAALATRSRRGRPLWAPLLLACVVAAIALTAAVGGGTLPVLSGLPGLSDASSATDTPPAEEVTPGTPTPSAASRATAGGAPPAATDDAPPRSDSPASEPSPSTTPPPSPTTSAATPPASSAAPVQTGAATPSTSAPAPSPAPAPAPAPAPVPTAAPAPAAPGPEGQVLTLVNTQRATAGCAPVTADAGLAAVARAHSADMRDRGYFSHVDPDGRDPFQRAAAAGLAARAENIAYGQPDAAAVMASWMGSPGHRRNILDCSLSTLGIGVATGPGGPWWTQLFG